jgi:hypothetical protein
VRGDPLVQAVLARFPGAEIVDARNLRSTKTATAPAYASSSAMSLSVCAPGIEVPR